MTTNVFAPLGFTSMRNKAYFTMLNEHRMLYTDTSIIGIGDVVTRSGGYITKCSRTATPIGIFQGWNFRTRGQLNGSMGAAADGAIVPWRKAWTGAQTLNANQEIVCTLSDDPFETFKVQCQGVVAATDVGKLVDIADCPGGPEINVFGRSRQRVTIPTTYYNITAYSVDAGGTGYTQNQVDLVIDGVIQDIRPADIVVTAGVIISITPLNTISVSGSTPTSTVQAKPGYAGSGATVSTTKSSAQTAAQFKIERILSQPFRAFDSYNNTTGYDMSAAGANAWLEVSYAKHQRGSTVATD